MNETFVITSLQGPKNVTFSFELGGTLNKRGLFSMKSAPNIECDSPINSGE